MTLPFPVAAPATTHKYDALVDKLRGAIVEMERLELGKNLAKGRVGEILLAHKLGHQLEVGDKGADGIDTQQKRYEYKVSQDDQYNFNFGHAGEHGQRASELATKHFTGITGAYCALMDGVEFKRIVYCETALLLPVLEAHMKKIKVGKTFQKNFKGIDSFLKIRGSIEIAV